MRIEILKWERRNEKRKVCETTGRKSKRASRRESEIDWLRQVSWREKERSERRNVGKNEKNTRRTLNWLCTIQMNLTKKNVKQSESNVKKPSWNQKNDWRDKSCARNPKQTMKETFRLSTRHKWWFDVQFLFGIGWVLCALWWNLGPCGHLSLSYSTNNNKRQLAS